MPGPAPTPKRQLAARGTWRAQDRPDDLELPPSPMPCPACLKGTARREWQRVVGILGPRAVLTEADTSALLALCQSWSRYRRYSSMASRWLREDGEVTARVAAGEKQLDAAFKRWLPLAARFGLTPADRARVKIGSGPKSDSKARFFDGGQAPQLVGA
jgi:P27 family predicted phage terminase small subunit